MRECRMDLSKEEKKLLLSTHEDGGVLTFDILNEDQHKKKIIVSLLKKELLNDSASAGTASRMIVTRLTMKGKLLCDEMQKAETKSPE